MFNISGYGYLFYLPPPINCKRIIMLSLHNLNKGL
jgi:hypothetical protein